MPERPTSVLVLAIIGIILAALGLFGSAFSCITLFFPLAPNPILDPLLHDHVYIAVMATTVGIGVMTNLLLLTCSIGSIRMKRWARLGMNIYACVALLQVVLGLIFNFVYVFPKMHEAISASGAPNADAVYIGTLVGGGCGAFVGALFPVCVLIFFNRRNVVDAFNGIVPPDSSFQPLPPV